MDVYPHYVRKDIVGETREDFFDKLFKLYGIEYADEKKKEDFHNIKTGFMTHLKNADTWVMFFRLARQ